MGIPHERALILSDSAGLIARIDVDAGYESFEEAFTLLPEIDPEMGGIVRKHLVFSLVSLHALRADEANTAIAIRLINAIEEPVDFVNSLVAAFGIVIQGGQTQDVMESIYAGIDEIPLAYDRASMLLSVVPIAQKYGERGDAERLLREATDLTDEIMIPLVAAMVRKGICQMYLMLSTAEHNEEYRNEGIRAIETIEDEIIRHRIFQQLGLKDEKGIADPAYNRLMEATHEILAAAHNHPDLSSIEYLIESLSDRAQRARYSFELFLLLREAERERAADAILLFGLDEASIIRPLSRRVYVLCDLALSLHEAGERKKSRDIIGMAVNAATNIRQDDLRDEVFNELDVAMRIIQEERM